MCGGLLLLAASAVLAVRGAQASLGQFHYFRAKYGAESQSPGSVVDRARRGVAAYPPNYRLCLLAGQTKLGQGTAEGARVDQEQLSQARSWCERGLYLNPYMLELRWLKTLILWDGGSPDEAIEYWREYVDWDYWRPQNHSALARLYARAGRWDDASRELATIRGTEEFEPARKYLEDSRREAEPSASGGK